ncbi:MAG: peptidylprolyl isomerase [Blastocatellia bacterium]|nr:peptidylprolyl isomerase [Blastocatellia bacterium]
MFLLVMLLFFQAPQEHRIRAAEHSRGEEVAELLEGVKSPDPEIRRLAVRALGRLERAGNREAIVPLLSAKEPAVRKEAVTAMGQIGAAHDWRSLLRAEADVEVRAAIYETIGRIPAVDESEALLVEGLADRAPAARVGAVKGLEAFFRLNRQQRRPAAGTLAALRRALRENDSATLRELALLVLNAANGGDAETYAVALNDPNPQVRRLAVLGARQWRDDPDAMVRYEALKAAGNCERFAKAVEDRSAHVALLAVDQLGARKCDAALLARLTESRDWRVRSRALVSLAMVDANAARARLAKFAADPIWQVRAYAAQAAKRIGEDATIVRLARDAQPNVVIAALHTPEEARRALASRHYGLVLAAATFLKGNPDLREAVPQLLAALRRLTAERRATSRDPRMEILARLAEAKDPRAVVPLRGLLADLDPAVAARAAEILSAQTGAKVDARTLRYAHPPFPSAALLRDLGGATAEITMKGLGKFTIRLFPEEAPATVAAFAQLADRGYYNGLTFHRIVPNFVIQGGSPGANEYDGIGPFMPDEVGDRSHARGTLGISTRGRDTGDLQIFVNLVDNFRLDHQYTVFAEVIAGMEIVDRVQEGDVMTSVRIHRRSFGVPPSGGQRPANR